MPDKPAIDATPANPSPNPTRHCRDDVAVHLAAFDDEGLSQRQFAAQHDLPRSTAKWPAQQEEAAQKPRGPGRPVDYPLWIQVAQRSEHAAATRLAAAQGRQERMRGAIRGLGTDYHPFDLTTGAPQSAEQVQQRLEARFATIEQIATEAELPEHCRARIAKARRVLGGLVAALSFFWVRARARVAGWPSALRGVWQERLLAGAYLRRASGKVAKAAGRAAL
jgi:hypothetical protein